jgi:hypothetical protein
MPEEARYLVPFQPADIPGLVAFWDFADASFRAAQGEPYVLQPRSGNLKVTKDPETPFGSALVLEEGDWLSIPRRECPALNFHGSEGRFTVVAWIRRSRKSTRECEFLAGMWNETGRTRQYGLFLNISVWSQHDQVCGHLSQTGGPSPGYQYCIDGPTGATPVPYDQWTTVAMSYDGVQGYAWLNGNLDVRPGLNPYSLAGGDGGKNGSDFTVGAVDRHGQIGNFFAGHLGGLAVYSRALSPSALFALAHIRRATGSC